MQFPLQPFLDRVIVEVIPIEGYYEQPDTVKIELNKTFSQRSERGVVRSVGSQAENDVKVGDVVQFDPDTAYAGLIYLNPGHRKRTDMPEYLQIRVGDLLGRISQ